MMSPRARTEQIVPSLLLLGAVLYLLIPCVHAEFPAGAWKSHNVIDPWCIVTDQGWSNLTLNCTGIGNNNNVSAVYLNVYTPGMAETAILRWHNVYGWDIVSDAASIIESFSGSKGTGAGNLFYCNFSWAFDLTATYPGYINFKYVVVTFNFGSDTKWYYDASYLQLCTGGGLTLNGSGLYWGWFSYAAWRPGTSEWLHSGPLDTVDFYDNVVIRFIYDVPVGTCVYVYMSNLTHTLWVQNITSSVVWKWGFTAIPRWTNITHGYYTLVMNCTGHGLLAARDLYMIRPGKTWSVNYKHIYYGKPGLGSVVRSDPIEVRCKNYRYWRQVIDAHHPLDAEAQGYVTITLIGSGIEISKDTISFHNDTARMPDLVAYWTPHVESLGSYDTPYATVAVYLYKSGKVASLVYSWNVTLEPYALGAGGIEEFAYAFGLPRRLVRYLVALAVTGVVMIIVYSVAEVNPFATMMFFFAILMVWAIVGWFPIWIPAFVLIILGGVMFMGAGTQPGETQFLEEVT